MDIKGVNIWFIFYLGIYLVNRNLWLGNRINFWRDCVIIIIDYCIGMKGDIIFIDKFLKINFDVYRLYMFFVCSLCLELINNEFYFVYVKY